MSGGADGILYVYIYGVSESGIELGPDEFLDIEDEDDEDGLIWLKYLCHLQNSPQKNDAVVKVDFMAGASRILSVHASGAPVVWCRDTSGNGI